ncbi:unnamed protein product [Effrenium voratum]|uniref:RRM domain-containing protein n=1 Tax=Effrenium voratum TaxID=2562239 RepID=A0AA36IXG2_9DINO|nr:unnamed protein product [Effrenium voratum]
MYGAYGYAGYHGVAGPMRPPPPPRLLPGMDPATGVVWPGGKRPPEPMVKAANLSRDITVSALKQALSKWGVDGIKEVLLADSRFGQVALFLFKEVEKAQLMMMAQGVEVEGRPLMLEFLPATKAEKKAKEASRATELLQVSGLPKKMEKNELVTHLRSHGVLGISQVVLQKNHEAIVRFNEERDVPKAISKANNTTFKEKKLKLEPLLAHWDVLFPHGEPLDFCEPSGYAQGDSSHQARPALIYTLVPATPKKHLECVSCMEAEFNWWLTGPSSEAGRVTLDSAKLAGRLQFFS